MWMIDKRGFFNYGLINIINSILIMVVFKLWNGTLYHFIIIVNKLISSYIQYYWSSEKLVMLFQHGLRGYPCSALPLRSLIFWFWCCDWVILPLFSVSRAFYWPRGLSTPFCFPIIDYTGVCCTGNDILLYFCLYITSRQTTCILRVREITFLLNLQCLAPQWTQWLA